MIASNGETIGGNGVALLGHSSYAEVAVRVMLDNVRRLDGQRWSARCPLHDDRDNSLAVWFDGDVLSFKCYAGCAPKDITDYLCDRHPEYADILGRAPKHRERMSGEKIVEDAKSWFLSYLGVGQEIVSSLPISFSKDEVIFRFPGIDRYKVRRKGEKGAVWRGDGHTPDLWPLPGQTVGEDIVITEGETDCIVARSLGLEAYAITKGAAAGLPSSVLIALRRRGARRVVVAMDADSAGRQAAAKIVIAARQAGLAAIDLDLVTEGLIEPLLGHKDLRDAYKYGKGQDIVEAIRHLLYRADEARPSHPRKLAEIMAEEQPTDFVVEGLIRAGGSTILVGEPKLGKSQMSLDIALAVARGEQFCGLVTKKGRVIYYALEDGEDIVRDRVRMRGLAGLEEEVYVGTTPPVVEDNVAILEEHIDAIQPTLIIVDTLRAISLSVAKSENEASFADAIYRITKLARERGVAALIVHHTVKEATGNPINDARGTSAIAGAVDVVAGLYRRGEGLKLAWRGRFGSGEMEVVQHANGSFNYPPSVVLSDMNNADYTRRIEERLAQYYEACRKSADKNGRVDVKKVVIAIWGLKDGKYKEGSWDKTYKALDELVRRQKLRKKERQYYIVQEEDKPPKGEHNELAKPSVSQEIHQSNKSDTPAKKEDATHEEHSGEDGGGIASKLSKQLSDPSLLNTLRLERRISIDNVPKDLAHYMSWALYEQIGELANKVANAGERAAELLAKKSYAEVEKLIEPIKAEVRKEYAQIWANPENKDDVEEAVELLSKIILAKEVVSSIDNGKAMRVVLATKLWRDVLSAQTDARKALGALMSGEDIISGLLHPIHDLSDWSKLARSLRLLRINLPRL